MEVWLWAVIGVLLIIVVGLLIKIHMLQKAVKEIECAFADKLITDTNTLIDISSRDRYMRRLVKSINVQLRKLREERHRFQRGDLELKDAITNISHDLRTPLTAICGYLDLLGEEEKTETVKRYVDVIRNRTEILMQLTEELFRYSVIMTTKEELKYEDVSLNRVLEECIAGFYAALTERRITPKIELPEETVIRKLDASAMARIFSNLLNNAIKYSDGDLEITMSEKGEIVFSNMASKLDKLQVEKLFDRFYTVEDARKSTGLGLAIAKTLVNQMKGEISAKYEDERLSININFP